MASTQVRASTDLIYSTNKTLHRWGVDSVSAGLRDRERREVKVKVFFTLLRSSAKKSDKTTDIIAKVKVY